MELNLDTMAKDAAENAADTSDAADTTNIVVGPTGAGGSSPQQPSPPPFNPTFYPQMPAPTYTTTATPAPVYTAPTTTRISSEMVSSAPQPMGDTITQTVEPGKTTVNKEHKINWGGVIKGVAVVTAVVLVGAVGFWALSHATGFVLTNPTIANAATATVHTVGNALSWAGGYVQGFFGKLFASHAATLVTHQAVIHSPATVHAITKGAGLLGIGATAVTLPTAFNALKDTHLVNSQMVTHTTPPTVHIQHTPTPIVTQDQSVHTSVQTDSPAADLSLLGNSNHGILASESAHTAMHLGHSGSEIQESYPQNHHDMASYTPDVPDVNTNRSNRSKSWTERFMRPSMEGSFASKVAAPSTSYTEAAAQQKAASASNEIA